jgi:quercetin dioxygenase-like cupin family protein
MASCDLQHSFSCLSDVEPTDRSGEHGGVGAIVFRRMLRDDAFTAPVDFVDVTRIPPQSTIGLHHHPDTEEIYIVLAGEPIVSVDGTARRLRRGDVSVVHTGGSHALENDTDCDVEIAVVQLRVPSVCPT